jgi:hypothetical protein
MTTKILSFKKSEHALLRQWERAIPDKIIYLAIRKFSGEVLKNTLIHVKYQTLNAWGHISENPIDLFIKINGATIVTMFFCASNQVEEYLNKTQSINFKLFTL